MVLSCLALARQICLHSNRSLYGLVGAGNVAFANSEMGETMSQGNWAFVFARGGSKGLPRKNIRILSGLPLIAWTIRCATASGLFERIIVSTDDGEIAAVARENGAEVPFMRPAELAADESPEWKAWQHAVHSLPPFARFVCLPATAPLRSTEDVAAAVSLHASGGWDIVISVAQAVRHPSFNMVEMGPERQVRMLMPLVGSVARRQDAPSAFDITPVAYVTTPEFICRANGIFEGRVGAIVVPRERAIDIDDEVDFLLAEALMERRISLQNA